MRMNFRESFGQHILVLTLFVGIATLLSCRADIVIPPDPGIEGKYIGTLMVVRNYNAGGVSPDTFIQNVVVEFRDANKTYSYRDTLTDSVVFCGGGGGYSYVEARLKLSPTDTSRDETCNPLDIPGSTDPTGIVVGFDQRTPGKYPDDSLILSQTWSSKFKRTLFELKRIQ